MIVFDLVYLIELNNILVGTVTKNIAFKNIKMIKNAYIQILSLIATNWLSGYASNVVKTYIKNIDLPNYG